jgi:AraC family transcriptional regulator
MHCSEIPPCCAAISVCCARPSPAYPTNTIVDEREWRALPQGTLVTSSGARVIPTRWRALMERTREVGAQTADDRHVVKIVLRSTNFWLSVAGRTVQDGVALPGMFHVTEPAVPVRCLFRGPYDVLHLHVPNNLIAECARDMPGYQGAVLYSQPHPTRDSMVERLGRALLEADQLGCSFGQLYADGITVAIVARILASTRRVAPFERPKVAELTRWRLKRALDYVEARLAEPVSLADLASSTGLTRMHFAAQFRAATGLRPHEYLLRRRIERAQEMLVRSGMSVVDVALSVGFQTQSHFTTVFKRFVGQTPRAWRQSRSERNDPGELSEINDRTELSHKNTKQRIVP